MRPFLLTYALGIIQHGYLESPLEAVAFELSTRFEQRNPIKCVVAEVAQHAVKTREDASAVFRRNGIELAY